MTTAEEIIAGLSFYLNQGSPSNLTNAFLRWKAWFNLTQVSKRVANSAPYWWKNATANVSLTAGVGTLPADFSHLGTQGAVYVSGQPYRIVEYKPPEYIRYQILNNVQSGIPLYFTFDTVTAGLSKILTWPPDSSTLIFTNYIRKTPELIDAPLAPTGTVTATAGNPSGIYTYCLTNVTAAGETEGGEISGTVTTGGAFKVNVLIPKCPYLKTLTSRRLYRTAASGYQHKLVVDLPVATAPVTLDYTYLDNVADGSLGANVPLPAASVSGLELFPSEFHESAIYDGLVALLAASQDDGRTPALSAEWDRSVLRQWEEIQPGQNQVHAFPAFPGSAASRHSVWSRWTPPR